MKDITLQQLLEAGCHFGHQSRRWNPAMKRYVYAERDGVHIFDLVKTKQGLEAAAAFAKKVASEGGVVLFVGTKRQAQKVIREQANRVGMPFLAQRWLAGLLTNFEELRKRLFKLADLKAKREAGVFKKYTKKEQLLIDRDIAKLEKFFGGVAAVEKKPQAVFIVDSHREIVAVKEAAKMGVPVLAMVDTNADPAGIDYVIPTNDDAEKAIELVVTYVTDAIEEGLRAKNVVI
jgi:small subunit ribosomal protein S2